MKDNSEIPYEILSEIFSNIQETEQLVECQSACKKWSKAVQEQFYKEVHLHDQDMDSKSFSTLSISPTLPGTFVKILYMEELRQGSNKSNDQHNNDLLNYLTAIVEVCPNIESLCLPQPISDTIINRFVQEREKGNLQHVRSFVDFWDPTSKFLQLSKIALAFRSTIIKLHLCEGFTVESPTPIYSHLQRFKTIMNCAQDFPKVGASRLEICTGQGVFALESYLHKFLTPLTAQEYYPNRRNVVLARFNYKRGTTTT